MHKVVRDVGVDSGIILVCDVDYYKKYEKEPFFDDNLTKIIDIKSGIYRVYWEIKNTWNGDVDGNEIVKIKSGKLTISDPCYCMNKGWDKWLEDTNYGEKIPKGAFSISEMGGDGKYDINLVMELAEEI